MSCCGTGLHYEAPESRTCSGCSHYGVNLQAGRPPTSWGFPPERRFSTRSSIRWLRYAYATQPKSLLNQRSLPQDLNTPHICQGSSTSLLLAQRPESDLWTKSRPSCLDLIPIYSIITFNPLHTPLASPFKSLYHNLLAQDVEVACRLPTVY